MLTSYYSYCPRSGSRVKAAQPTDEVAICRVASGTIAVGDLVTLTLSAAQPGHYYRHDAVRLGEQVIPLTGGMCEDAQGAVTLVVPRHRVPEVLVLIQDLLPQADMFDLDRQAWQQRAATLRSLGRNGATYTIAQEPVCGTPIACVPGWKERPVYDADGSRTGETVTVPALYFTDRRAVTGVQYSPFVGDPHWVENRCVHRSPFVCVTDKGRPFTADLTVWPSEYEYETPRDAVAWLQIDGPQLDAALEIMGIPTSLREVGDAYYDVGLSGTDIGYPTDLVTFVTGYEPDSDYLQVHRGPETAHLFPRLEPLASQINRHACYPEWAGWRHEMRDLTPAPVLVAAEDVPPVPTL